MREILRSLHRAFLLASKKVASVLIAGGWIWFAVERLGAGLEKWERVYVVAGLIVLVGLALPPTTENYQAAFASSQLS